VNTLVRCSVALISLAPNVAPPADGGMSGDGRQTWSLNWPSVASAGAVTVSTYNGTASSWPAA
jgi:hypothetical protein